MLTELCEKLANQTIEGTIGYFGMIALTVLAILAIWPDSDDAG